jgi:hypothetical protein
MPTELKEHEFLGEHLPYELMMLRYTLMKLGKPQYIPDGNAKERLPRQKLVPPELPNKYVARKHSQNTQKCVFAQNGAIEPGSMVSTVLLQYFL